MPFCSAIISGVKKNPKAQGKTKKASLSVKEAFVVLPPGLEPRATA